MHSSKLHRVQVPVRGRIRCKPLQRHPSPPPQSKINYSKNTIRTQMYNNH